MKWSRAAALGLGAMKATDSVKEALFYRQRTVIENPGKSAISTLIAVGGAFYLGKDEPIQDRIATALAASGLAAFMHEIHALVTTTSDLNKGRFMEVSVQRARRAGIPATSQPGSRTSMPPSL